MRESVFYVVSVVFDSIKVDVGRVFQGQLHAAACHPDLHTVEKERKNTVHHKTKKQSHYNKKKKDTHGKELVANLLLLA